eukprot:10102739-Prorocentrum_lima.AAC.1
MTSSLVGSEMCIRDRHFAQQWPSSSPTCLYKGLEGSSPPGHWSSLEPVSYTHLTLPTICSV